MVRQRPTGKPSKGAFQGQGKRKIVKPESRNRNSIAARYVTVLVWMVIIYLTPVFLIYTIPALQAQIIFMPIVSWPPFMNLSDPVSYGLEGTRNFYLESENSIKLGAWHILPKSLRNKAVTEEDYNKALTERPVFLYVHGNAGTRGGYHRVGLYKVLTELDVNVICYDYRGFGDSTNERPTASGLVADSKAVYRWIQKKTANKMPLFVWGHSMGTAIASRFVSELAEEGVKPSGVVLESGFNTVKSGMINYPLARLYNYLPFFEHVVDKVMETQNLDLVSEERVKKIKSPLLMLHAADDHTVNIELGRHLKNAAQSSRNNLYFKYIEFKEIFHYGHKYIFTEPTLPKIVRDLMHNAIKAETH